MVGLCSPNLRGMPLEAFVGSSDLVVVKVNPFIIGDEMDKNLHKNQYQSRLCNIRQQGNRFSYCTLSGRLTHPMPSFAA